MFFNICKKAFLLEVKKLEGIGFNVEIQFKASKLLFSVSLISGSSEKVIRGFFYYYLEVN